MRTGRQFGTHATVGKAEYADNTRPFANRQGMPLTPRQSSVPRHATLWLALTALFGFVGPFGTYMDLALVERLAYWGLALGVPWGLMVVIIRFAERAPALAQVPPVWRLAGSVAVWGVPATGMVYGLEAATRDWINHLTVAYVYVCVVIVGSVVVVCVRLTRSQATPVPTHAADARDTSPRFLDRLPADLGTRLLSISAEDHYIRAVTDQGSTLILMRFSDALAELDGLDGERIHRSHWVAADAVMRIARDSGRLSVHLTDGRQLPVSRQYGPAVRARCWTKHQQPDVMTGR